MVTNLTYMQLFSVILLVLHTEDIQLYEVGASSSGDFRELAETGNLTAVLLTLREEVNECCLCGLAFGQAQLAPGDTDVFTITLNEQVCPDGALFSMASMLVNTNDAFFGIDSMPVAVNLTTPQVVLASALDAGTEINNELCSHIPGPACDATSGNEQAEPGEGFIHVHRGFRGVGPDLAAEVYDWRNPVAEICIS